MGLTRQPVRAQVPRAVQGIQGEVSAWIPPQATHLPVAEWVAVARSAEEGRLVAAAARLVVRQLRPLLVSGAAVAVVAARTRRPAALEVVAQTGPPVFLSWSGD